MITVSASLFQRQQTTTSLFEGPLAAKVANARPDKEDQSGQYALNRALKESVGVEMKRPVPPVAESFDVDAVVDTVMSHVQKRIDEAAAAGATDDELQSMMDAAREGVEKGFGQARDELDALGKLDEALGEKIDAAEEGIYNGLNDLEDSLFGVDDMDVEEDSEVAEAKMIEGALVEYESEFYRQKNSFSFEVMTQEGDRVTINAYSASGESNARFYGTDGESEVSMEAYSSFESSGFSLSVEGDLNDDELAALEDLFSQVNDVADSFYEGDMETAFNMALELNSDADQIAQFSLNLRQSEVAGYQYAGAQAGGYESPMLPRGLAQPLQDYANGVREAVDTAQKFQNPLELVHNLMDQLDTQNKMNGINGPLFKLMEA